MVSSTFISMLLLLACLTAVSFAAPSPNNNLYKVVRQEDDDDNDAASPSPNPTLTPVTSPSNPTPTPTDDDDDDDDDDTPTPATSPTTVSTPAASPSVQATPTPEAAPTPDTTLGNQDALNNSPEDGEEPSPSPDAVCVDEQYLLDNGHSSNNFVHTTARLVRAYCPLSGLPCASADHMVRVAGKPLSYKQYCATTECTRRAVKVNSVLTHLWQEKEHNGVVLTMFDNRYYETPQKMLHWSMHMARKMKNVIA